jgi:hypothetical protein
VIVLDGESVDKNGWLTKSLGQKFGMNSILN